MTRNRVDLNPVWVRPTKANRVLQSMPARAKLFETVHLTAVTVAPFPVQNARLGERITDVCRGDATLQFKTLKL